MAYVDEIMLFAAGFGLFFLFGLGIIRPSVSYFFLTLGVIYAIPFWAKLARGIKIVP